VGNENDFSSISNQQTPLPAVAVRIGWVVLFCRLRKTFAMCVCRLKLVGKKIPFAKAKKAIAATLGPLSYCLPDPYCDRVIEAILIATAIWIWRRL
jgi:hypothetical protein